MKKLLVILLSCAISVSAYAQSSPGFTGASSGNTSPLTASSLNAAFAAKQDHNGDVSGSSATANGVMNTLATWIGYLAGTPNPNQVAIGPGATADTNAQLVVKVSPSVGGGSNAMWFEGSGGSTNVAALGPQALRLVYQSNSVYRGTIFNFREMNSAGTMIDQAALINPGLQWWDAGHEQTDFDFGGFLNGVYGIQWAMSSGCINGVNTAANNGGGIGCPVTTPPNFSPNSDGVWSLGLSGYRLADVETVKVNGVPATSFATPASSSAACTQGQIEFDAAYVYTCVATNTWRRAATTAF